MLQGYRAMARPTKYQKKFCKELIAYFDVPLTYTMSKEKLTKSGEVITIEVERVTDLPTFERFAHGIGVVVSTLWEWKEAHPEFSIAYARANALQEQLIAANAMAGRYVGPFAQFYLKNKHLYKDRQELTGAEGTPLMPIGLDAAILARRTNGGTPSSAATDSD
jgi:hypothetical protein